MIGWDSLKIVDLHRWSGPYPPPFEYVYCGRRIGGKKARAASPLQNPFKAKECADQIGEFRKHLAFHIKQKTPSVMAALAKITEKSILACWCVDLEGEEIFTQPEVCHVQVIAKAVRFLKSLKVG